MTSYTYLTDGDLQVMLDAIGISDIGQLFDDVPAEIRLDHAPSIGPGMSELEMVEHLTALAAMNVTVDDEISFLGAGMYDHYVPAVIDSIASRSEFVTPYTPYQPEVAQGSVQVVFEFQTAICELTGMPVANASVYDGASAVAAAAQMAVRETGRRRVVVSRGVHPHARQALDTHAHGLGVDVTEVPLAACRTTADVVRDSIDDQTAAVIVAQPNFLGGLEDLEALAAAAHERGALFIVSADPMALSVLEAPGNLGADICVGEGQCLGGRLDFGGPSFGFFAAQRRHVRAMPGRIAGQTVDADGRRCYGLVLQTREQHIRRETATSNICTSQAHNALCAILYLTWLGRAGFVELGELLVRRTDYARRTLAAVDGVDVLNEGPVVREFAIRTPVPAGRLIERCAASGVHPGFALDWHYPEYGDGLLVAITERRTREDIDRLCSVIRAAVADLSHPNRNQPQELSA